MFRQLDYIERYPDMIDFWPECSEKARTISNEAISSFYDLIENTNLDQLAQLTSYRDKFVLSSPYLKKINKDIYVKSLVSSCFWFSDYFQVLEDLRVFSKKKMPGSSQNLEDKIDLILEQLEEHYTQWYHQLQSDQYTTEIAHELEFLDYLIGRWNQEGRNNESVEESQFLFEQPKWFLAQFHLVKGQAYNEAMLYENAIEELTMSIECNPDNLDAYIERAFAYFELQQIDLAVEDYKRARYFGFSNGPFPKKLEMTYGKYNSAWTDQGGYVVSVVDYAVLGKEFCSGVIEGASLSATEYIPNTLSTLTGIGHGLWAFACSPTKVSKNFLDSMYNLMIYIRTHSSQEILEQMVPELRELIQNWDQFSNPEKSNRMGFIVGKYGFDIFAPCACIKGIKRYQELKHANTMFTLENCLYKGKRAKILEEVVKRDGWRKSLFKDGRIGIHWGMQEKHIPGSHNFDPKRSKIFVSSERLELLLTEKAGTGQKIQGSLPYSPGYRERVNFGEIIGEYVKINKNGEIVSITPSSNGIIHYSKKGMHVVPSDPYARMK